MKSPAIVLNLLVSLVLVMLSACSGKGEDENVATLGTENKADSVKTAVKVWDTSLVKEIQLMAETDQKYRQTEEDFDRHYIFQSYIDSVNTKRLMEIIRTYGYPTAEKLKKKANTTVILMHAPESFFPELRKIIEEEKKNIHPDEYSMLTWHLNGRVGKPF